MQIDGVFSELAEKVAQLFRKPLIQGNPISHTDVFILVSFH